MRAEKSSSYHDSAKEDEHLSQQHGLTKTTAYIRTQRSSQKERSATAARVAKHRALKKANGIVAIDVPQHIAESVKRAGSFDTWIKQTIATSSGGEMPEERRFAEVGRRIESLPTWIRWMLFKLLM